VNATCPGGAIWWPDLLDALTTAALANGCHARFLVSWWTHSDSRMIEQLKSFEESVKTTLQLSGANGTVRFYHPHLLSKLSSLALPVVLHISISETHALNHTTSSISLLDLI